MRKLIAALVALCSLTAPAALAQGGFPKKIPLPNAFAPEGIEIASGTTFYVGSTQTGAIYSGDVRTGAGRIIIVSSIAGVMSGPSFGPYSMTKHALEAMGKAMRAELAPQGIDVTLLNPGPYLTGFNDRMADSMWEWFGDESLCAPATPMFQMMRELVTNGQMDPAEVVARMVELTEADTTTENNFVPPEILAQLAAQLGN